MSNGNNPTGLQSFLTFLQGIVPLVVAIAVLYFFWAQLKHMTSLADANVPDPQWSRAAYLFGGVEAIAFAAAGFLFGREVHRRQAEKAEDRADKSQKKAEEAKGQAAEATKQVAAAVEKGKSIAELAAIKASAAQMIPKSLSEEAGASAFISSQSDLEEIAELARRLFPQTGD